MPRTLQVFREPERVEIPDRIEEQLRDGKASHKARFQQRAWANACRGRNRSCFLVRQTVDRAPCQQPQRSAESCNYKRGAPAKLQRQKHHHRCRNERTNRRSAVEDAGGKCTLLYRKPLGNYSDSSGPVSCLTHTEKEAAHAE